jgi:hypothetical protein
VEAVLRKLGTALSASLTAGKNLFPGRPREPSAEVPLDAVFAHLVDGGTHDRYLGTSTDEDHCTVQVTIRGDSAKRTTYDHPAAVLGRSIRDALHCADLSASGYWVCYVLDAEPVELGAEGGNINGWLWTMNVELAREAPAS